MRALSAKGAAPSIVWMAAVLMVGIGPTPGRAQGVVPPNDAAANPAVGGAPSRPPAIPSDVIELEEPGEAPPATLVFPGAPSPTLPARVVMGPLEVIHESIFGAASKDEWQPLSLGTFFSEGWDEPFAKSPEGTNEAPKQNWLGAADGIFMRLNSLNFQFTDHMTTNQGLLLTALPWSPVKPNTNGNQYFATYNLYLPLNRRLELLVVAPFITSNTTSPTGHYVGNFGDLTISSRFHLIDQRNFSLVAFLAERTPTGKTVNGNDVNFITPSLEFWWNFAPKWVLRGGTGINIDTGRTSATDVYFNNLAIGRYLTTKDARLFKELAAHVSVSTVSDVLGRKDHITDVYITPGFRFCLDRDENWSVLTAVQVPVSGPHPYDWQLNLALVRNY